MGDLPVQICVQISCHKNYGEKLEAVWEKEKRNCRICFEFTPYVNISRLHLHIMERPSASAVTLRAVVPDNHLNKDRLVYSRVHK